jgi:hypothetical protein
MKGTIKVDLPTGLWADGVCSRTALLRPITGEDEAFLLEASASMFPSQWVTALLARCLVSPEDQDRVTEDTVRSLCIGDREALLLHLRRLTFGDRLQCILACPFLECKEKMDLDLNVRNLLLQTYSQNGEWHNARLHDNGHLYDVRFRLPTGADQEAVSGLAQTDLNAASSMLLRRCIGSIAREDDSTVEVIPQSLETQLSSIMSEMDPQAELMLNMTCPACHRNFSVIFDTASYLSKEMASHMEHIYRDVHMLAFYYHWSESEIMGMTQRKRERYLDLLDETLKEWR